MAKDLRKKSNHVLVSGKLLTYINIGLVVLTFLLLQVNCTNSNLTCESPEKFVTSSILRKGYCDSIPKECIISSNMELNKKGKSTFENYVRILKESPTSIIELCIPFNQHSIKDDDELLKSIYQYLDDQYNIGNQLVIRTGMKKCSCNNLNSKYLVISPLKK